MAASSYLLRIIAKPKDESVSEWLDWYKSDHLPETLSKVNAIRSGLYHAYNTFELKTKTPAGGESTDLHEVTLSQNIDLEPPGDKVVLVMAQIDSGDNVEETFKLASPPTEGKHAAEADIRLYKLIEDFDPRNLGHARAPFILNVQILPIDVDDYNTFYSGEHLHMLSRVPGYRRSQRYEFVTADTEAALEAPQFMAVHEWDHLNSLDGPKLREADASENTIRVIGGALKVNIRGFENLKVYGDYQE